MTDGRHRQSESELAPLIQPVSSTMSWGAICVQIQEHESARSKDYPKQAALIAIIQTTLKEATTEQLRLLETHPLHFTVISRWVGCWKEDTARIDILGRLAWGVDRPPVCADRLAARLIRAKTCLEIALCAQAIRVELSVNACRYNPLFMLSIFAVVPRLIAASRHGPMPESDRFADWLARPRKPSRHLNEHFNSSCEEIYAVALRLHDCPNHRLLQSMIKGLFPAPPPRPRPRPLPLPSGHVPSFVL